MWTGDTLHGPVIGGAKSYLFAFTDDHSRAVMGARWAHHDDVVRMAAAFRPALQARGVPKSAYLDYADPPVMPTGHRDWRGARVSWFSVSA